MPRFSELFEVLTGSRPRVAPPAETPPGETPPPGDVRAPVVPAVPVDRNYRGVQETLAGLMTDGASPAWGRGGHVPAIQNGQILATLAKGGVRLEGRHVLDFGCGALRPMSHVVLMYLLGARSALAIDLEQPSDPAANAVAEYLNILTLCAGIGRVDPALAGTDLAAIRRRAADFDLAALLAGDLWAGLPPHIRHRTMLYQDLPPDLRAFDLMFSNSVLEHVANLDQFLACARESINPGGYVYASIDFRDHRVYSQKLSPWQYLIDDGDHAPAYINKIRYTAMMQLIQESGFEIVVCDTGTSPAPDRATLLPHYRDMSEVDLVTGEAQVLFRPV